MAHVLAFSSRRAGNSSDSDEEINTTSGEKRAGGGGEGGAVVVLGEAPESDDEEEDVDDGEEEDGLDGRVNGGGDDWEEEEGNPPPPPTPTLPRLPGDANNTLKYNTILHRKLRDKNEQLKRELMTIACHPYESATKEIGTVTQQLIRSQKMVQGVSATLRKVSRDLFLLEDTLDAIRANKGLIPGLVFANEPTACASMSPEKPVIAEEAVDVVSSETSTPSSAMSPSTEATV